MHQYLKKTSFIKFFLFYVVVLLMCNFFFDALCNSLGIEILSKNPIEEKTLYDQFFFGVLFAPLLETLLCQYLPIETATRIFQKAHFKYVPVFTVVFSAICFSLIHTFSLSYMLRTFILGLVLGYAYLLSKERMHEPIWSVTFIHAVYNFTVFLIFSVYAS